MPHPEREHELQIALATAILERDAAKDRAHQLNSVALERGRQIAFERERFSEARKELTALKSEHDALRAEVKKVNHRCAGLDIANDALRDLVRGLLDETHPAMRDILIAEARAALAGGWEGK